MNNIQADDWADDSWGWYTGMTDQDFLIELPGDKKRDESPDSHHSQETEIADKDQNSER